MKNREENVRNKHLFKGQTFKLLKKLLQQCFVAINNIQ